MKVRWAAYSVAFAAVSIMAAAIVVLLFGLTGQARSGKAETYEPSERLDRIERKIELLANVAMNARSEGFGQASRSGSGHADQARQPSHQPSEDANEQLPPSSWLGDSDDLMEALESELRDEPRDHAHASALSRSIDEAMRGEGSLKNVDCGDSYCKAEMQYENAEKRARSEMALLGVPGLRFASVSQVVELPDGSERLIWIVAREGHVLPVNRESAPVSGDSGR